MSQRRKVKTKNVKKVKKPVKTVEEVKEATKESQTPVEEFPIGRHKRKNKPVATVMTEAASTRIDETKYKPLSDTNSYIHRPRG